MTFRYGIVGRGAIGLGLAQLLSNQECTMLSRQALNIDNQSITFSMIDGNHKSVPIIAQEYSLADMTTCDFKHFDLLILPVKYYHLERIIQQLRDSLPEMLPLLLLQNGLGGHDLLSRAFPVNPVFLGATTDAIAKVASHQIHIHARGELVVGSFVEHKPTPALANIIETHPNAVWNNKILNYLYRKLAVNAVINPLTAKFQCRNGNILQHPVIVEGLKQEVFALYTALALDMDLVELNQYVDSVITLTANNYSSMYQDVMHQRPTEVDSILGVLLKKGAAYKVPLPLIQNLYDEIKNL